MRDAKVKLYQHFEGTKELRWRKRKKYQDAQTSTESPLEKIP